ncbi:hypothetical protein NW768_011465 [Fusarium equiseti]|uniref:Cofilin n=1 Tax=Fusarium equiseti TaxID=61235 RepID=A0ABQ8QXH5_FUSEQ|nr:hypothetical protein NW768_011465 [Fusarium equiseti]
MASGVTVNPACVETYQELRLKKSHKFIIFKLSKDNTDIVVDQTYESSDWEDFLKSLPEDEPVWAVYDFQYEAPESGVRNKLVFFSWTPDGARTRAKMLHASSKDALRRALVGIATEIQATEHGEVAHEAVLDKVRRLR